MQTDSASTLVGLSAPTFQAYFNAINNAELLEGGTNFLIFPKTEVERLGNMTFTIGGQDFLFPPAAQVFPTEIAAAILGAGFANSGRMFKGSLREGGTAKLMLCLV